MLNSISFVTVKDTFPEAYRWLKESRKRFPPSLISMISTAWRDAEGWIH